MVLLKTLTLFILHLTLCQQTGAERQLRRSTSKSNALSLKHNEYGVRFHRELNKWRTRPQYPYGFDILSDRLEHLRDQTGFSPSKIIDVGANKGDWTTEVKSIFKGADMFMVEAASKHERTLSHVGVPYTFAVLGDEEKMIDFFQTKTSTGNSMFRETSKAFANMPATKRKMRMLDNLLAEKNFTGPYDLLKIDTQGAEILVMKGATKTLTQTTFVLLELSLQPFNEGAPRMPAVVAHLNQAGFITYDVTELHYYPNGMLAQMDMLFVKKAHKLANTKASQFF